MASLHHYLKNTLYLCCLVVLLVLLLATSRMAQADPNISQVPLFVTQSVTPQVMLTMSNDHQLYFEAYTDYADLTGDGKAERTYNHDIDYYGYFDSYKCYDYDTAAGRFVPESVTSTKYCSGNWSGNFLNYISMARIDVIRKILYGGYRSTDTATTTVLERTYLPNDAHSWVRYYDGSDIDQLTPFSLPPATSTTSTSSITVPDGSANDSSDRENFTTTWNSLTNVQIGDQLLIRSIASPETVWMHAVVRAFTTSTTTSTGVINVQVTQSSGAGTTRNDWEIVNESRRGISFCNTTVSNTQFSHDVNTLTDPPLIRIAQGNYSLWTANERWQCRWHEEHNTTGHDQMRVGGINFSNGNNIAVTGIAANSDNPVRDTVGLGENNYIARVQACVDTLLGNERCKVYPDGNHKPIGLIQEYGEDGQLLFGLLTGSYTKNKSGGVLRKNIGNISNEINIDTDGTFKVPAGGNIIDSLDRMRIYGYSHSDGTYGSASGDYCPFGLSSFTDGRCTNWGNPQSEMFLETLRYFSGATPTSAYTFSGDDKIPGLGTASWNDPLSNDNWCSQLRVIAINSSISSYDHDQFGGLSDIGASNIGDLTNIVGSGEGIHGADWFIGEAGTDDNQFCTPKSIANLGTAKGLCPEGPTQSGTFHIAGLAHYAYTESIRGDLLDSQNSTVDIQVKTYGVELAPAVPTIDIPLPNATGIAVRILPACENWTDNTGCGFVDFRIVEQDISAGTGKFLINWEAAEWGGDYDSDMNGILSYEITSTYITVTTEVFAQSSGRRLAFGYVISGTTQDGFHAHSGINGYNYTDASGVLGCNNCTFNDPPTSVTYTLGASTADLLQSPLFYAAKWGGFHKPKRPQDPDFPNNPLSWDAEGDGKPDNYYFAIDPGKLAEDLEKVFRDVVETTSSASSVVANSVRLDTGTFVYQARFRTDDWSGELFAFPVNPDGTLGEKDWEAGEELNDHADRNIVTFTGGQTKPFKWADLNATQQAALGSGNATLGEQIVDYIRGNQSEEIQNGGVFRNRERLLGDIINSDPVFVAANNLGYGRDSINEGKDGVYEAFLANISNRDKVIYVGANDGMLHGFESQNGTELLAYIPNEVIPNLKELTAPTYNDNHRYFVDGPARAGDAFIDGQWRTVLVGSTGAGGRSVFALDITNPGNFDTPGQSIVLWEFTHADLGYSIGQPTLARLKSGDWVAIFGNGYITGDTTAKLFILNLETGAPIRIIETGAGVSGEINGLSSPAPVDVDGDRITDYVYAGDLQGNLWKFDLTAINPADWDVAFSGDPLFTARDRNGNIQPISARPSIGRHPLGGYMVYFGTGRFFAIGDNDVDVVTEHQSFYGIRDHGSAVTFNTARTEVLQRQRIFHEGSPVGVDGAPFDALIRVTSDFPVDYPTQKGWFIDLVSPTNILLDTDTMRGERVVSAAVLRTGRIIFTTMTPSEHPCDFGGSSWLVELDALTGGRLDHSVFDLNGDMLFNEEDYVEVAILLNEGDTTLTTTFVPVSALQLDIGISKTPAIILGDTAEYKYFSGSKAGEMQVVTENPGDAALPGRKSWRQIR
ncbi:pilus assembly protein [Desulfonatronum thioautotrophicum]|uniref:pilus assembly protein n=1 Tax=Desulfonatronum thioautotrophicum TaxID=617001 RepID=UPI000A049CA8|nr:PilC/PilY family type IV pilus protein [Desulfonatronum thioautotrophicum]